MNKNKLKINFVLPPSPKITGGPLAILEYANRLIDKGHQVSITTYPDSFFETKSPFPWFDFKGEIYYAKFGEKESKRPDSFKSDIFRYAKIFLRNFKDIQTLKKSTKDYMTNLNAENTKVFLESLISNNKLNSIAGLFMSIGGNLDIKTHMNFEGLFYDFLASMYVMDSIPECDLNIATYWVTSFPVYMSGKGKPVYFMQHYEELFFPNEKSFILHRLLCRMSYGLPMYKVANSSWLQKVIDDKFGQVVPFSNNAIELSDFNPKEKKSLKDGITRIITYSRPEDWKGFGDAVEAMKIIKQKYGEKVEWNVFGYLHNDILPNNDYANYKFNPKLSFKELSDLYAISDIALCPSWYESFPLPPLEAMASGTAVITTKYGTEDYAFDNENALTINSRDIPKMVESLMLLIEDNNLRSRLAENGRKTAEKYTWDNAVNKREEILLDIHNNKSEYDIFKSSKLGFCDSFGVEFEKMPRDINIKDGQLIKNQNGDIFLIENGAKRHIVHANLIEELSLKWDDIISVNSLVNFRIPHGSPIFKKSDATIYIKEIK